MLEHLADGKKRKGLLIVLVGNDGASETYVGGKIKACEKVGFKSTLIRLEDSISEAQLLAKIEELNRNDQIDGFIVQLPLPAGINANAILEEIDPTKDADGLHPLNF